MITVTADPDRHLGSALCEICGTPTSVPLTLDLIGVPRGIRTPVTAVRGRCPGPLDDGDAEGLPPGGARKITRLTPGGQRTPREARRSHPPRSRRSAAGGPF